MSAASCTIVTIGNQRNAGETSGPRGSCNQNNQGTSPTLSGGDIDARWEEAESGGEEKVGGSTATPSRNDLDAIGKATGVTDADGEELKVGEKGEAPRQAPMGVQSGPV